MSYFNVCFRVSEIPERRLAYHHLGFRSLSYHLWGAHLVQLVYCTCYELIGTSFTLISSIQISTGRYLFVSVYCYQKEYQHKVVSKNIHPSSLHIFKKNATFLLSLCSTYWISILRKRKNEVVEVTFKSVFFLEYNTNASALLK
jgi:hypothetical protein